MRILIVCSGNSIFGISPFIKEQGESLVQLGINVNYFLIKGHGIGGYLQNLSRLRKEICQGKYDLVHAHYGFSGLLSVLQRKVPVIITFHGCDVNNRKHRNYSKIAALFSNYIIFVHNDLIKKLGVKKNYSIIPCGINLQTFFVIDKGVSRKKLNFNDDKKYILFSSLFDIKRKNYFLAKSAMNILGYDNCELIELKGYSRNDVNLLLNAVDLLLVTSLYETGPQVVREAMACNCPIVTTNVGDVQNIIKNTKGCYITSYDPCDVKMKIELALNFGQRTNGRENILEYDNKIIAKTILEVYNKVLNGTKLTIER